MTMLTLDGPIIWGPAAAQVQLDSSSFALDAANHGVSLAVRAPKAGTIDRIAVYCSAITGNPPVYKVGLASIVATTGNPAVPLTWLETPNDYDFTVTGIHWITLDNPHVIAAGDMFAVCVVSGTSAPDASNYASIRYARLSEADIEPKTPSGTTSNHTSTWIGVAGAPLVSIAYQGDSSWYGNGEGVETYSFQSDTSPDEVGAKFTVPVSLRCVGVVVGYKLQTTMTSNMTVTFYDGADAVLGQLIYNANFSRDYQAMFSHFALATPVQLNPGTTYRLTIYSANSSLNTMVIGMLATAPGSLARILPEGARWQWTERTDAGVWTDTADKCPVFGLMIDQINREDV